MPTPINLTSSTAGAAALSEAQGAAPVNSASESGVESPSIDTFELGASAAIDTPAREANREDIARRLEEIRVKMGEATSALPGHTVGGAQAALETSAGRILTALDAGRISIAEALRATHMLAEMVDALNAVYLGQYEIDPATTPESPGFRTLLIRTSSGDVIEVGARPQGAPGQGQARFKLTQILNGGEPVPNSEKLMVRFDLEGSELENASLQTVLDIQFGKLMEEELDKRIHGELLDASGQPLLNRGGRTIADHHFPAGHPAAWNDRAAFARVVRQFLEELRGTADDRTDLAVQDALPGSAPEARELELIAEVVRARQEDSRRFREGFNPYTIAYTAPELRHPAVIAALADAHRQGVDVQILVNASSLGGPGADTPLEIQLEAAGMDLAQDASRLSPAQRREVDLAGVGGDQPITTWTRIFARPDPDGGPRLVKTLAASAPPAAVESQTPR